MALTKVRRNRQHTQKRDNKQQLIFKILQTTVSNKQQEISNVGIEPHKTDPALMDKPYVQEIHIDNSMKKKNIQLKLISDNKTKQIKQIKDYMHITKNIYVDMPKPKTLSIVKWPECESCNPIHHGCLGCEMYAADMECHLHAHDGIDCGNQRMQRKQFAKTYVSAAGDRGRGLFCGQKSIRPGSLIIEYIGEVINENTLFERLNKEHFYSVYLGKDKDFYGKKCNFYIDSSLKGNEARFANHSCDPNAEARFVYIGNEKRIGLFAIKHIKEGEEITFDYRLETLSENAIPCLCGSTNCSGFIGKSK